MQNELSQIIFSASDFFSQILAASNHQTDISNRYRLLRGIFRRAVEQTIANCPVNFTGMFAKVDYIVKETSMPRPVSQLVHASRSFMFPEHNMTADVTNEQLATAFPHDLKATSLLVSYIFNQTLIPTALSALFPIADRQNRWGNVQRSFIRAIVNQWNNSVIYATEEDTSNPIEICYGQENVNLTRNGKGDWSYLSEILSPGCQLNLIRVRMVGGQCHPELIIYEPDYLINITTIANCFESYAESPLVALVNKLRPAANTIPIHLGNLAGQYLDDAVHHRDIPFAEGFMDFFRNNALGLVTCQDMFDADKAKAFYNDARVQQTNIRDFIDRQLPEAIGRFSEEDVMLEPSFYSEILGIQGRMDFLLQSQQKTVIIEQKSGKGAFTPFSNRNPQIPVAQEKHLVQLILYRALLVYEFNRYADQLDHIMLMYSKYQQGLLSTAQMPELMLRAIRMRNLLAWHELRYANEGMELITRLTPELLNEKRISGRLWEQYVMPQLRETLLPVRQASELERRYYLRFMRFLAMEQTLSKMGNKTKDNSGFAAIWHDSLDDKRNAGNIYDSLTVSDFVLNGTAVEGLTLSFCEGQSADTSNFRVGDIVILYSYLRGAVPDACHNMVHRATITDITTDGITLRLRNSQTDKRIFVSSEETLWAIEHDLMEASESALYRAMHSFLSASQQRRDLILCQRQPSVNTEAERRGEYGKFNELVTRARQASDLFIIIGPPGTGKTSYGLTNLLNEELLDPEGCVLLLSYTNRAVDEICSKLVSQGTDFLRLGSETSCPAAYRSHLLSAKTRDCRKGAEVRQLLMSQRVVCGTTASQNSAISLFSIKHFSLAIVDEASQILEPHLIGLLSAKHNDGTDAIKRWVLIGDHKQLPAVVQQTAQESAVADEQLRSIGLTDCRDSFFERMLRQIPERFVYMLTQQGRMHPDIAEFPNQMFYNGKLDIVPLDHQALPSPTPRVTFHPSPQPEFSGSDKTNIPEAELIAEAVINIYNENRDSWQPDEVSIGIIVPYRNQISTIRNAIDRYGIPVLHDITIDTVERYQGSQRDYIIYGFTIQHPYQLNFLTSTSFLEDGKIVDRKLNVAMTRARLHLLIFGNPDILRLNPIYYQLVARYSL